ncbi:SPOR domain-containing protein [Kaarinaea lacus]
MTALLKQRLIGAIVLISLGIIFIPMLLTGKGELTTGELPTNIPPKPLYEIQAPAVLPLEKNESTDKTAEPIATSSDTKAADDEIQKPSESQMAAQEEAKPATTVENASALTATGEVKMEKNEVVAQAKSDTTESAPPAATRQEASKPKIVSTSEKPPEKVATASQKPPIVSGWVVQLGSFSKEKNAIRLRDSLRKNDHASFVEAYERSGKTSYRVRVGPELTRELAEELKKQLKKETKLDGLVMSFPG